MSAEQIHEQDKRRSKITSGIIHLGIIILLILPLLHFPVPPPGQEGVMVSFGEPDIGMGDDKPATQDQDPELMDPNPPAETEPAEAEPVDVPEPEPKPEPKPEAKTKPKKKVMTTQEKTALKLKKQREKERQRAEAEARKKRQQEEARKRAEEEAKRKAAEEAARKKKEYEATKKKIGGVFGKDKGSGQGNTNKPGSQGLPTGNPDASKVGFGGGKVGGGLGSRGVIGRPKVQNTTNQFGKVVIKVCVDASGRVISAKMSQHGTTNTNPRLVNIAIKNAKKFLFTKGGPDRQCGTISYDFKPE